MKQSEMRMGPVSKPVRDEHMEYKRLGDIASYINGYAFKPEQRGKKGLPIIRIQDLTGNAYDLGFYEGEYPKKIEINNGDVLISWSASLGVYIWDRGKSLLNQHIYKVLFDKEDVNKDYFVFAVKYKLAEMVSKTHGATMKHIVKRDFNNTKIPFPMIEKQKEIAIILSKISNVIETRQQEIQKLDELIQARFVELFGDYINEGGKPLSELATITGGLTKNSKRNTFNLKMPYLRVANVFFNRLDLNEILEIGVREDEIGKTLLETGDLLFVEGNGSIEQIGRVAIWDGSISPILHQNHLIKARFHKKTILPEFALFYFMSQEGRQQIISKSVSTSGLNTLSVNKISSLILPMPPLELQEQFASFVKATDKSKIAVQEALDKTQLLFDSLMQKYFG